MKIQINKKEYQKDVALIIETRHEISNNEKEVIIECLSELNLDASYNRREALRDIAREMRRLMPKVKK